MANLKKIAAFGAAFLGGCLLGGAAGIYGEKKYQVSEKFSSKKQEVNTPSAEVVMAQQTQTAQVQNSKPVNVNNGNSNHPQQK